MFILATNCVLVNGYFYSNLRWTEVTKLLFIEYNDHVLLKYLKHK